MRVSVSSKGEEKNLPVSGLGRMLPQFHFCTPFGFDPRVGR